MLASVVIPLLTSCGSVRPNKQEGKIVNWRQNHTRKDALAILQKDSFIEARFVGGKTPKLILDDTEYIEVSRTHLDAMYDRVGYQVIPGEKAIYLNDLHHFSYKGISVSVGKGKHKEVTIHAKNPDAIFALLFVCPNLGKVKETRKDQEYNYSTGVRNLLNLPLQPL